MGRRVVIARLLMLWVLIVSLYFLWEAETYTGLYALLAEWQFEQFSHYWPVLTFALLLILFGSPAAWLLRTRQHADRRDIADRRGYEAAVTTTSNFCRLLFAFSGGLACAALVTLLWTLTLPRIKPPKDVIAIGSPQSIDPQLGPVTLRGQIIYTRTSAFAQDLMFTTRGVRFAPILAPGDGGQRITYFVELLPGDFGLPHEKPRLSDHTGVLLRNKLPGSIVRLYRYAGHTVEEPFYVLYASNKTLRWPYFSTAAQLAIGSLIALIAALLQNRYLRRISAKPDDRVDTPA